jgi:hypothetical protein
MTSGSNNHNNTTSGGGGSGGGGGRRTNPHWLQYSSFHANDTLITIVPSFSSDVPLPLLSSQHMVSVGPFVAGMPCQVPLWMAKVLQQRQLAQIQLPDWLSSTPVSSLSASSSYNANNDKDYDNNNTSSSSSEVVASYLVQVLHAEKKQSGLIASNRLPFYYYEIARALSPSSNSTASSGSGGRSTTTTTTTAAAAGASLYIPYESIRFDNIFIN